MKLNVLSLEQTNIKVIVWGNFIMNVTERLMKRKCKNDILKSNFSFLNTWNNFADNSTILLNVFILVLRVKIE